MVISLNYVKVKAIANPIVDNFIDYLGMNMPVRTPSHFLFPDNFICNINRYISVFEEMGMESNIFYSCKANKSTTFLKTAADNKCGIEVSSFYELKDALKYTNKIIASGPGKSIQYLRLAIENGVIISVDDIEELKIINQFKTPTDVLLRISNPLGIISRFGIDIQQVDECLEIIQNSVINLLGFSFHLNNYSLDDRVNATRELLAFAETRRIRLEYIDIGGGMPVKYCSKEDFELIMKKNNSSMYFKDKYKWDFYPYYCDLTEDKALKYILARVVDELNGVKIIIEPGRSLLSNCGISVFSVMYVKHICDGSKVIVTNGNINSLSEQWFNSDYLIEPRLLKHKPLTASRGTMYASVAGNLCLEQDMITWRKIKFDNLPENGDLLVYFNTAGYQMDSNESTFHKIPLVPKRIVYFLKNRYQIEEDSRYDCGEND